MGVIDDFINSLKQAKDQVNNNVVTEGILQTMRGVPLGIAQTGTDIARRAYAGQNPVQAIGGEAVDQAKGMANQLGNYAQDVGAGLALNGKTGNDMYNSQKSAIDLAGQAMDRARTTSDPAEKARLTKVASDTLNTVQNTSNEMAGNFSPDVNQNPIARGLQTGANIAGAAAIASPLVEGGIDAYSKSPLSNEQGFIKLPGEESANNFPKYRLEGGTVDPKTGLPVGGDLNPVESNPAPQYAQVAPEYPKTEANPEAVQPKSHEWDSSQWPQTPEESAQATPKKPFKLPGQYDPIEDVSARKAATSSKAYAQGPDIQAAYRRNGITDPIQVDAAKQKLYTDTINPTLEADQTRLPIGSMTDKVDGLYPQIVKEMRIMNPAMDESDAITAAQKVVNTMGSIARNEGDTMGNSISLKNTLNFKTMLNDSNAVQNNFAGIRPTTPEDLAVVATRNVLQDALEKYSPSGITQAVKDYGLLEEGFPSYQKAYSNPPKLPTLQVLGTKIPLEPIVKGGSAVLKSPAALGVGGVALGAGTMYGLNQLNKNKGQAENGYINSGSGSPNPSHITDYTQIPQSMQDVNSSEALPKPSDIKGTDGQPLTITENYYKSKKAEYKSRLDAASQLGIPDTGDAANLAKLEAQWAASDPKNSDSLTAKYNEDSKKQEAAFNVESLLNQVSPGFFNQFKSYDQFQKNNDPQYAGLKQAFQTLANLNPGGVSNLFTVGNKDAALKSLDQAVKQYGFDYFQSINTFTGYSGQTDQTTQPTQNTFGATQSNPQGLPAPSVDTNFGNTMQGSGFKPSFFQEQ